MADDLLKKSFERLWQHTVAGLNTKSDIDHSHDDMYYTEIEIDTKLHELSESIGDIKSENYYTKEEIDKYEFITTDDIDGICGGVTIGGLTQNDINELLAQLK